jgi:hypothetical protein
MSHILNISSKYTTSKSYFGIKQMMRNSEKLADLKFEVGYSNSKLGVLMTAIGDSIEYVNTFSFSSINSDSESEEQKILDFYSRMKYPKDISFSTVSNRFLGKLLAMPKRLVEKRLSMSFDNNNFIIPLEVISVLKPTIVYFSNLRTNETRAILKALENTRIKEIWIFSELIKQREIQFDFSKYPELEYFRASRPNRSLIQMNIINPEKPFDSLVKRFNSLNFNILPDNLFFPYLERIFTNNSKPEIFVGNVFPREIFFDYPFCGPSSSVCTDIGFWPSVEIITFNRIPEEFNWKNFPNLRKINILVLCNVYRTSLAVFNDVPKSIEINTGKTQIIGD